MKALDGAGLQHLVGFLVAMADQPMRRVFEQHIGQPHALREVEFSLLMLLRANAGAAPKQLAQALSLPPPNVSLLLDRLEARGLLERSRSPTDGRALQLHLTAAGQALAQQVHAVSLTMEDGLMQAFSHGERAMLRELLVKLVRAGQAHAG